jgi:acetoin utilization deacetylase AcuC-like enzyme
VSTHQSPFYPGTGAADEVGAGEGRGFTVNVPMEAGCTDDDYALVYRAVVAPVLEQFAPDLLLVSAGYDAHERDPLASMRVTTEGYGSIVQELSNVVTPHGALAMVTEGGYDLPSLAACLERSVGVLSGSTTDLRRAPAANGVRGERAVAGACKFLRPFWSGL